MSVMYFELDEVADFATGGLDGSLPAEQHAVRMIRSFFQANDEAFYSTYKDQERLPRPNAAAIRTRLRYIRKTWKRQSVSHAVSEASSFSYNLCSNAGVDFTTPELADWLLAVPLALARREATSPPATNRVLDPMEFARAGMEESPTTWQEIELDPRPDSRSYNAAKYTALGLVDFCTQSMAAGHWTHAGLREYKMVLATLAARRNQRVSRVSLLEILEIAGRMRADLIAADGTDHATLRSLEWLRSAVTKVNRQHGTH